jgi:hypothetical protein
MSVKEVEENLKKNVNVTSEQLAALILGLNAEPDATESPLHTYSNNGVILSIVNMLEE